MRVSVESTKGLERRLKIELPAERVDQEVLERLEQAKKTVKLKGFRKGKVPLNVVKRQYGKGVRQEVIGEIINSSLIDAIKQEGLRPAGQPRIDGLHDKEGASLEFLATFDVYPSITLGAYADIEVDRPSCEILETDVDDMIEKLRDQRAIYELVDRASQEGDQVTIDFVGKKDEEEFPGGKAEDYKLILGSGAMIPGFESGLVGHSVGDTVTLNLTFPDDYHSEELKGCAVVFVASMKAVAAKSLPELDDEFFANFGVDDGGWDKFRSEVRANMERELGDSLSKKIKSRVMHELYKQNPIDVPQALVDGETENLKRQMLQKFGGEKEIDLDSLPDHLFSERASYRAALSLLLSEIIRCEQLVVDKTAVRAKIEGLASSYENPQEVIDYYYSTPEMMQSLEMNVLEEMAIEKVLAEAKINSQPQVYDEAIKPDPEPDLQKL
jgi:trigger factor